MHVPYQPHGRCTKSYPVAQFFSGRWERRFPRVCRPQLTQCATLARLTSQRNRHKPHSTLLSNTPETTTTKRPQAPGVIPDTVGACDRGAEVDRLHESRARYGTATALPGRVKVHAPRVTLHAPTSTARSSVEHRVLRELRYRCANTNIYFHSRIWGAPIDRVRHDHGPLQHLGNGGGGGGGGNVKNPHTAVPGTGETGAVEVVAERHAARGHRYEHLRWTPCLTLARSCGRNSGAVPAHRCLAGDLIPLALSSCGAARL